MKINAGMQLTLWWRHGWARTSYYELCAVLASALYIYLYMHAVK